ncbi:MAG: hypothetical protein JO265_01865 [Acidimicrobiia bacterium]|nr:hypothetical protein [Acidimicrobiia bacterium]
MHRDTVEHELADQRGRLALEHRVAMENALDDDRTRSQPRLRQPNELELRVNSYDVVEHDYDRGIGLGF